MSRKYTTQDKLRGAEGFEMYYRQLFGERWPGLKAALLQENEAGFWQTAPDRPPYFMDTGSIRAALSLRLDAAESVLDMCAAPGGKTLVLSSLMKVSALLTANERSRDRMMRLCRVADQYMEDSVRNRVTITCGDGAALCRSRQECYDAILLDAPCSSERHVLASPSHLAEWSPARIKSLSVAQWALLSSAFRLLKPGGSMVYATCALSPVENDGVVSRLEKKFDTVRFVRKVPPVPVAARTFFTGNLPPVEVTGWGFHILPDTAGGAGPLYFSVIQKIEAE